VIPRWVLLATLVALTGGSILAQEPGTLTAEPLPDSAVAETATVVADTPTRRPTRRRPTATPTDTASATATPTDTPPTRRPRRRRARRARHRRRSHRRASPPPPPPAPRHRRRATRHRRRSPPARHRRRRRLLNVGLGALLALLSAWLGARIARAGERRERTRGRRAIASAMLFELRRIDAVLRRVVALDTPSSFPSLEHPSWRARCAT
jgi:hypothetical protein